MTEHPITPPPELRRLWAQQAQRIDPCDPVAWMQHVSTQAARWGAGQELEACCEWADATGWEGAGGSLRATRRPKPPSLKEQALAALRQVGNCEEIENATFETIRRALEALPE